MCMSLSLSLRWYDNVLDDGDGKKMAMVMAMEMAIATKMVVVVVLILMLLVTLMLILLVMVLVMVLVLVVLVCLARSLLTVRGGCGGIGSRGTTVSKIMLLTVVGEVVVDAMVMNMSKTAFMKTPMPTTVLVVMMTLMVMVMVVTVMVMVIVSQRLAALSRPPGSGLLLSAGSGVLWVLGSDIISCTRSGANLFPPPPPTRCV